MREEKPLEERRGSRIRANWGGGREKEYSSFFFGADGISSGAERVAKEDYSGLPVAR